MSPEENKAALLTALRAFNDEQRREEYFRLYADQAVLHRAPPLAPGLEAIKEWYRSLWRSFPDAQIVVGHVIGDREFVASNFRLQGTHRGPFLGALESGKRIDVEGVTILRFRDGKCVERWSQTDLMGIRRQIGASV